MQPRRPKLNLIALSGKQLHVIGTGHEKKNNSAQQSGIVKKVEKIKEKGWVCGVVGLLTGVELNESVKRKKATEGIKTCI